MMTQLIVASAIAAAMAGALYYAYDSGVTAGENAQIAKQKSIDDVVLAAREAAIKGAADAISKINIRNVTIQGKVEREIINNVQYRDCEHSPDGLLSVNQALTNTDPKPSDSDQLPGKSRPTD